MAEPKTGLSDREVLVEQIGADCSRPIRTRCLTWADVRQFAEILVANATNELAIITAVKRLESDDRFSEYEAGCIAQLALALMRDRHDCSQDLIYQLSSG